MEKCFAVVYDLCHLGLKGFCGVGFGGQEVVGLYELFYFVLVVLCG